jgi:DNA-binding CsgD family transcriptional regulator
MSSDNEEKSQIQSVLSRLTTTQILTLRLLLEGKNKEEIARERNITTKAVDQHIAIIYEQFQLAGMAEKGNPPTREKAAWLQENIPLKLLEGLYQPTEEKGKGVRGISRIFRLVVGLAVFAAGVLVGALAIFFLVSNRSTNPPPTPEQKKEAHPTVGGVLFADNFDSGKMKPEWQAVKGDWRVVNGRLTTISRDQKWSYLLVGDPQWTDYAVEVEADYIDFEGGIQVFLRVQDINNLMSFYASQVSPNGWLINKNGNWLTLVSTDSLSDTTVTLRAEVKGDLYTAYINGARILSINDPTYTSGRVGVGIWCSSYPNCSTLDNFKVIALP